MNPDVKLKFRPSSLKARILGNQNPALGPSLGPAPVSSVGVKIDVESVDEDDLEGSGEDGDDDRVVEDPRGVDIVGTGIPVSFG